MARTASTLCQAPPKGWSRRGAQLLPTWYGIYFLIQPQSFTQTHTLKQTTLYSSWVTCQLYCSFPDTLPQHSKKKKTAPCRNFCLPMQTSVFSFICFTFNVILQGPLNNKHSSFFFLQLKQSGIRRTLRAFLYFICFTFNVILQGPLNKKHRSVHALSYTLSASRLMLSFKAHLTINTDHCMCFLILYLLHV